jgi:hypothetical protein
MSRATIILNHRNSGLFHFFIVNIVSTLDIAIPFIRIGRNRILTPGGLITKLLRSRTSLEKESTDLIYKIADD